MIVRTFGVMAMGASAMALAASASAQPVTLVGNGQVASIAHDGDQSLTLAATMLSRDLNAVTGRTPALSTKLEDCARVCVVVAQRGSALMEAVARDTGVDLGGLDQQWERYLRVGIPSRSQPGRQYLLIAGSDMRGAIWGVVDLSRDMGVSAWEWWADVTPRRVERLVVDGKRQLSQSPSVQYRGIFLNDEDWGLQPWAAKTFEPETGDIGPKTYARIFELMWRLKANLIWPAMHESTKPFYQIPGNAEMARDYAIVVGTSHAEPMMRNNVREWDEATQGHFNFFSNRDEMLRYWGTRAKAVKDFENIYTVGLRGVHDSEMEGASSPEMARGGLQQAIDAQRKLLAQASAMPVDKIPQVLTLYKEVLDLYSLGLNVPDDVTLVWPEDNYGYINQLPTASERARRGGAGVYYHISYWGRPHDYLWLATTHPALIREQMERAWETGARKIWVLNVGDIKPGEYLTQYFLDLAFDHRLLQGSAGDHLTNWARAQFDRAVADEIAGIMTDYYGLAFERRPEFMGFSQVEPITPISIGAYVRSGGAEAQQRIDRYDALRARAEALAARIPADRRDAFYELVLYPVRGAASLNERNLKLDLAALYSRRGQPAANLLADEAKAAHNRMVVDTAAYNTLGGGKWRGIMDMAPRALPVFAEPPYPHASFTARPGCVVDGSELTFVPGKAAVHALTIRGWGEPTDWTMAGQAGVTSALSRGRLDSANGYQQRVTIAYDGKAAAPSFGTVTCGGKRIAVEGRTLLAVPPETPVEIDHIIAFPAANAPVSGTDWERIEGLGAYGAALRTKLSIPSHDDMTSAAPLAYDFDLAAKGDATLHVVALPVHPLTSVNRLRIAIRIDDGAPQLLDFETHGRSDEWKANVLSNTARRTLFLPQLAAGKHRIRLYAMDPGFLLDRMELRLDGAPDRYGAPLIR
ncbi:glycosyl hydrolase 115 family protein [Sphingobium sp. BYY-5]|uniref:glycosyl hydrolase 115 family protein n=1 Tax=Sphingobium sp. BYY-5 TaxID=2926400 RepID=UPI001FA77CE0|nr:glycosyl hydrolase 115 family protein [Sphingobium sp. BYY-5]MCI4590729.1 glycosyl hydrolase 115 family protein [Sphingobium sp. BYY-5]